MNHEAQVLAHRRTKHWNKEEEYIYLVERGKTPLEELAKKLGRTKRGIQRHDVERNISALANNRHYTLKEIADVAAWSQYAMGRALKESRVVGIEGAEYFDGRWHIYWDGGGIGIAGLSIQLSQLKLHQLLWQHEGIFVAAKYIALNLFNDSSNDAINSVVNLVNRTLGDYMASTYQINLRSSDHNQVNQNELYFMIQVR